MHGKHYKLNLQHATGTKKTSQLLYKCMVNLVMITGYTHPVSTFNDQ